VQQEFIDLLQFSLNFIGWTNLLFGFWIIVFSCVVWVSDRIFPISPVLLTLLRMAVVLLFSFVTAFLEILINNGFVVS
jgi:uncharacterized membrane protein